GIGNALVSAKLASKVITQALEELNYSEEFLKQYEKMLWEELDTELQTSYKMQRLGKYKFILNLVIGKAAKKPKLRETLSHTLVSEKPFKEIVTPLGLLKMLLT
ncbi:MAG: dynein light chain Tctex-type family protein, partial [Candidatus Diapherotrites archaeon]|nr:dynein light chain Tctex-type family protein [Candidatus Diapherotrites archaeon]